MFVATTEKNHEHIAILAQVHAIAGAEIQPQFKDSIPHGLMVAEIAEAYTVETDADSCTILNVPDPKQPIPEKVAPGFSHVVAEFAFSHK